MTQTIRSYSELITYETFDERFDYLMLGGGIGIATFGFDRYLNQTFYGSKEWQDLRRDVIVRDEGCDLGLLGYEIQTTPLIHHVNPITPQDVLNRVEWILDPEYLITTVANTHNAIHYGDKSSLITIPPARFPNDTKLW